MIENLHDKKAFLSLSKQKMVRYFVFTIGKNVKKIILVDDRKARLLDIPESGVDLRTDSVL